MMSARSTIRPGPMRGVSRRSFTLVEAVISIVLVGVMLVAAIHTLGATAVSKRNIEHQALGYTLAADLMAEILSQAYEEPDDTPEFGRESSESGGDRADWDDVDDYDGWSASPPETKDQEELDGYDQWTRSVEVVFVKPTNLNELGADTGVKRITVTVAHNTAPVAELVAVRTAAWPVDTTDDSLKVLFVIAAANPTAQEQVKVTLMESWGFAVILIDQSDTQANFDTAITSNDVVYISTQVSIGTVGTKVTSATIGVVNEKPELVAELGFIQDAISKDRLDIQIVDNSHYITSELNLGMLTICSSLQSMSLMLVGTPSPDLHVLGKTFNTGSQYKPSLATLSAGDALWDVGTAAGRRVELPWGYSSFDINSLNTDGQTLMKRAIEWAANKEQP